jgi:hypothetical protein
VDGSVSGVLRLCDPRMQKTAAHAPGAGAVDFTHAIPTRGSVAGSHHGFSGMNFHMLEWKPIAEATILPSAVQDKWWKSPV